MARPGSTPGSRSRHSTTWTSWIWEKLICNVCFSGVCGVLELTVGEVLDNPDAWSIASRCAQEALDVANGSGISLDIDDCERYAHDFGRAIPGARPSPSSTCSPEDDLRSNGSTAPSSVRAERRGSPPDQPADHVARAREGSRGSGEAPRRVTLVSVSDALKASEAEDGLDGRQGHALGNAAPDQLAVDPVELRSSSCLGRPQK